MENSCLQSHEWQLQIATLPHPKRKPCGEVEGQNKIKFLDKKVCISLFPEL
jgi:hypothetical protein